MTNEKWIIDGKKLFELVRDDHRINGSTFSRVKEYMGDSTIDAVEVVHGRWEQSKSMVLSYKCSKCKGWVTKHSVNESDFNYCPNCGAKMDEV